MVNSPMDMASSIVQLSPQTGFKLGAACTLVLVPGERALRAFMAGAKAGLQPPAVQNAYAQLVEACVNQLAAVTSAVSSVLHRKNQPQAAAAFASSTARPLLSLPWVHALSQAVLQAVAWAGPGKAHWLPLLSQHPIALG